MPPKSKPNGYSMYVSEQCKKTNIPYAIGFSRFASAWQSLDKAAQERYKERAKELKALASSSPPMRDNGSPTKAPGLSNVYSLSNAEALRKTRVETLAENRKRLMPEIDDDDGTSDSDDKDVEEGEWDSDEEMYDGPPRVSMPPKKKFFVGGDCMGSEINSGDPDDNPEQEIDEDKERLKELTSPYDHMKNVLDAYVDINEIKNHHAFVLTCTPVIFAQGYKKAANAPRNRPVEIGMVAFGISDGLEKVYLHEFIDPGPIPVLETCHAKESRLERHGIPCCPEQMDDEESFAFYKEGFVLSKSYYEIVSAVLRFMGYDGSNEQYLPPVLVPKTIMETTECCFRWLATQAQREAAERKLPGLPQLKFGTLNNFIQAAHFMELTASGNSAIFPDYDRQLADVGRNKSLPLALKCKFHRNHTSVKLCALGAAREASYVALCSLKDTFKLPYVEPFMFSGEDGNSSDTESE